MIRSLKSKIRAIYAIIFSKQWFVVTENCMTGSYIDNNNSQIVKIMGQTAENLKNELFVKGDK